jgi:hypothetical protein
LKYPSILFLLFYFLVSEGYPQIFSSTREKTISEYGTTIVLDTLSIIPKSVKIFILDNNTLIHDSLFQLDFAKSIIYLSDTIVNGQKILRIEYKVFPYNLALRVQNKKYKTKQDSDAYKDSILRYIVKSEHKTSYFQSDGLIKSGNITRGITVGNNQNPSLMSSLNIQLQGQLSDDIDIKAVITDNSIPIQPEGNTQQLQEFDKVFIQLQSSETQFTAGDFEIAKPNGYFMNYFKKTQGGQLMTSWKQAHPFSEKDSVIQRISVSAGISKGKFARNNIKAVNGNQGPYKLSGTQNELFIIVLAGTERVFINGELLKRGHEFDYIIDYNTAEITFNANHLVTSETRIHVEFEYSDKNYVRSIFAGNYSATTKSSELRIAFFSEQDAKNQPLQQTLDDEQKLRLQQAGDDPLKAVFPGWQSVEFNNSYVLYEMKDTLDFDSIFVYSTNQQSALYRVQFSYVGQGNGNYILAQHAANGRVFRWVAPQEGVRQGAYEPYTLLIAPQQQQMLTIATDYKFSNALSGGVEFAVSNKDVNTFSTLDGHNNIGTASKMYLQHNSLLRSDTIKPILKLKQKISYEFTEAHFTEIDRFRPVEFERNWNLQLMNSPTNKHLFTYYALLEQSQLSVVVFQSDYFIFANNFKGLRNALNTDFKLKNIHFHSQTAFLHSEHFDYRSIFLQQKGTISMKLHTITPGVSYEHEYNIFRDTSDMLLANSYHFYELEGFIGYQSDTSSTRLRLYAKTRNTNDTRSNMLLHQSTSNETGIRLQKQFAPMNTLSMLLAYRQIELSPTSPPEIKADKNFISRIEQSIRIWKGAVTSSIHYETGAGVESKKEYSYLEVLPGQGQYTWTDYNGNNIKELDEFEIAQFQNEANYIRILIPVNEYINVNYLICNTSLHIEPSRIWNSQHSKIKQFVSKFSNRLNYSVHRRTASDELKARFNPLYQNLSDTTLIQLQSNIRNTFFFNRAHPRFSAWYTFSDATHTSLLVNGIESRHIQMNEFRQIWNFAQKYSVENLFRQANKTNSYELLISRNYNIIQYEAEPRMSYQSSNNARISLSYRHKQSTNVYSAASEQAVIHSVSPELRYVFKSGQTLQTQFTWYQISYNADANTPIAFEMLEAYRPGTNFSWRCMLQYMINRNMQLNFMYEGRKPHDMNIIHTGSVQIKALL